MCLLQSTLRLRRRQIPWYTHILERDFARMCNVFLFVVQTKPPFRLVAVKQVSARVLRSQFSCAEVFFFLFAQLFTIDSQNQNVIAENKDAKDNSSAIKDSSAALANEETTRAAFLREVNLMAKLTPHANVLQVSAAFERVLNRQLVFFFKTTRRCARSSLACVLRCRGPAGSSPSTVPAAICSDICA